MSIFDTINKPFGSFVDTKGNTPQLLNKPARSYDYSSLLGKLKNLFSSSGSKSITPPPDYSGYTPEKMKSIFSGSSGNLGTDLYNNFYAPVVGAQTLPITQEQAQAQQAQTQQTQVQPAPTQPTNTGQSSTTKQSQPQAPAEVLSSVGQQLADITQQFQNIQEQAGQIQPKVPTQNVDVVNSIDNTLPTDAFSNSGTDLSKLLADQKKYEQQLIDTLTPTQAENDLITQINNLKANEQLGLEQERNRIAPMALVTGRQEALQRQAAIQENLLTNRLGIEQNKRTTKTDALKTLLGFRQKDIDTTLKIQDAITQQNSAFEKSLNTLSDNARSTMSIILDKFKGIDYNELDGASQDWLLNVAQQANIPFGVLVAGMKANKDQQMFNNQLRLQESAFSKADVRSQTADNVMRLARIRLEASKGIDNYVDPKLYMELRDSMPPSKLVDFDSEFAKQLNPADAQSLGIKDTSAVDNFIKTYLADPNALNNLSPEEQANIYSQL